MGKASSAAIKLHNIRPDNRDTNGLMEMLIAIARKQILFCFT